MLQTSRHPERNALLADAAARADYTRLLLNDFHSLETLIRADGLERDISRVGYVLELNFLDRNCEPACIGGEVVKALDDARFTTEFARFNLELNSQPIVLHGRCLAQLLAGPVLATAANSPLFLGKQLWQETRIELFEQATDTRVPDSGVPVHLWEPVQAGECLETTGAEYPVHRIMTTTLYKAKAGNSIVGLVIEHDLVKLAQALVSGQQSLQSAQTAMRAAP